MSLRPFSVLTLLSLLAIILSIRLGLWQVERMHEKQELIGRFELLEELGLQQAIDDGSLYAHVRVRGHYRPGWHLLLDNKILNGRAGVHVFTLFEPDKGLPILVNRGWLPLPPDRSRLPEIPTPAGMLTISGILNKPATDGIRLGDPDNLLKLAGPRLITYLDLDELTPVVDKELSPWLIQLDASDISGFAGRDWKPTVMQPEQHRAYALQWFGLALVVAAIWLRMIWKLRGQRQAPVGTRPKGRSQNP